MLTLCGLLTSLLGQAPALPPGHPEIPPMAHANPSAPGPGEFDPDQPLPPGHPAVLSAPAGNDGGVMEPAMSAKEILDRLDKMKEQLKGRPKTAEIEFALGNLYYENSRWPEAIDSYRQLLERAEAPLDRYLKLRERARQAVAKPGPCDVPEQPSFDVLIAAADRLAQENQASKALACYEAALDPLTVALTRQGNAWYLIGNEDKAIADHERALQITPDSSDNLFFLGAILFEGGDGDLPRLKRAKDYWQRFLRSHPDPDREKLVSKDILRLQMAIDNHGHVPAEMPPRMRAMAVGPIQPPPPAPRLSEPLEKTLDDAIVRGEAALSAKRWEDAREAFGEGRKLDTGNLRAARGEGIALLNLGKLIEAEGALRDALGRDPDDSLALYELGEVFFKSEHYTGAARFWSMVLEQDPKLAQQMGIPDKLKAAQQAQ
jgi:tetratricopeptide (TPR) repeat protein